MFNDIKYAVRTLTHAPAFAIAALITLAIGIGANTVVFSMVNALLLRPLPVKDPSRLVQIYTGSSHVSYPNFRDFDSQSDVFTDMAAHRFDAFNLADGTTPERISGEYATGNYFTVLGVDAIRGRVLQESDDTFDAPAIAVISEGLWKRRLGSAVDIIGKTLRLNGNAVTIAGIVPSEFHGTYPIGLVPEVWVPLSARRLLVPGRDPFNDRQSRWLELVARLRPNISIAQAQAVVGTIAQNLQQAYPDENSEFQKTTVYGLTGIYAYRGIGFAPVVFVFVGFLSLIVLMILFIACANVANLFLARSWSRQREFAIRISLGAKRSRIVRQLMTENLVVALLGGLLGCVAALGGIRVIENLPNLLPIPLGIHLTIDRTVLLYAFGLSLLTGVMFGIGPAMHGSRRTVAVMIPSAGTTQPYHQQRFKDLLVVAEIATCCVLLVCTGLFARSLRHAGRIDPGFETQDIVTAEINLETSGYGPERGEALLQRIIEQFRSVPGVRSARIARLVPLSLNRMEFRVWADDPQQTNAMVLVNNVSPDYFSTMKIPLVTGREFSPADTKESGRVVIVSEAFVRRYWPGQSPLGKRLRAAGARPRELGPSMEVVGVVRDSKYYSLGEEPQPVLYQALAQAYSPEVVLHIATALPANSLTNDVRQKLLAIDSTLVTDVRAMQQNLEMAFLPSRIATTLMGVFGLLGLILASAGIYSLIAYTAGQRRKEIGIRMAVGADRKAVVRMVIKRGLVLSAYGLALGVAGSLGFGQIVKSFLIGIRPTDPLTFAFSAIVVFSISIAASLVPALRAANVNPVETLRSE